MDTLVVVLIVGAAAAFVAIKVVKAARAVARGKAPTCCGGEDTDTPAGRAAESTAVSSGGLSSPCASCTGCPGH